MRRDTAASSRGLSRRADDSILYYPGPNCDRLGQRTLPVAPASNKFNDRNWRNLLMDIEARQVYRS